MDRTGTAAGAPRRRSPFGRRRKEFIQEKPRESARAIVSIGTWRGATRQPGAGIERPGVRAAAYEVSRAVQPIGAAEFALENWLTPPVNHLAESS